MVNPFLWFFHCLAEILELLLAINPYPPHEKRRDPPWFWSRGPEDDVSSGFLRQVGFWSLTKTTFQKSKKPKIRLISQELSVFVPDQSTFSYLVAFLPPCFFGRGETAWDIERVSTQSFSSPFCSAAALAKPKSHLQAEADWWKASWLFHHQSMHLMINGVPQFSGIKIWCSWKKNTCNHFSVPSSD